MRKFRKMLAILLSVLMIVSVATAAPLSAEALETENVKEVGITTDGNSENSSVNFKYSINDDNTVTITKYTGSEENVVIPDTIEGLPVVSIGNFAFQGCSSLTIINIPYGVTSIGYDAFRDCSDLTSINIPDGVTSIDEYAFYNCSSLTSINIPVGVTSISGHAFCKCSSLTSINIPDGVTNIGNYAFYDCSSLTSINIPDGVKSIGEYAFQGCSNLTSINIPDSVTSIGNYAFYNCESLTSINISEGVKNIGMGTFESCSSLTSIIIPDGVTSIGDSAFQDCSSLTSITIPDGVTSIGNFAFEYCFELTSITIPDGVKSIGHSAFERCSNLTSINIPDSVTSIGNCAFEYCSSLTSINIPDGVTSIGSSVFKECSSLTSIIIPVGVTSIGDSAFKDCYSLASVNIPDGVTSIRDYTFYYCSKLTSINIPDGVTSIGNSAFYNCTSLTSINIPDGVTSIGDSAFTWCSCLTSINIPNGVTDIGNSAFARCEKLTSVNFANGVKNIGESAFFGCSSLTSICIPDSITSIGEGAFSDCSHLMEICVTDDNTAYKALEGVLFDKSLSTIICCPSDKKEEQYIIPSTVTKISDSAFSGCSRLTSINIPDGVTSMGDFAFSGCSSLININIPDGVTSIGKGTFNRCSSLKSINIPDSVTSIDEFAFGDCSSLTSINIPDSVTSIGDVAFYGMTKLSDVLYSGSKEQWNLITIGEYNFSNATIHYNAEYIKTVAPDCTNKGYDLYSCSECEDGAKVNLTNALGHDLYVVEVHNPTCGDRGYTEYSCRNCGYSCTDNFVDATGEHDFVNDVCTVCGENKNSRYFSYSITDLGTAEITGYNGSSKEIAIPSKIKGYRVTSIGNYAFYGCSSLTSINIPDSVTSIGRKAFYSTSKLSDVLYSGSEEQWNSITIGRDNFSSKAVIHYNAEYIKTVEPDCGNKGYDLYSCSECEDGVKVNFVEATGNHELVNGVCTVCGDNTNFSYSIMDAGTVEITDYNATSTEVEIPSEIKGYRVTSIGNYAFEDCTSLTSVNIPDGVTSIGNNAFRRCKSLTSINIPDSVTSIGNAAFPFYKTSKLSDVLYSGSKEQWNSIIIGEDNFRHATIHYDSEFIKTVAPDCTNKGYDLYSCSECADGVKVKFTEALGHNFVDGICERCGKDELDCIESLHPYENNTDEKWTIYKENAKRIAVIFSEETETESSCDYIYIYNKDNEEIGRYSGKELSGKRIVVQGDTVKIRLTSDGSVTYYGFSVLDIVPYYEDCNHTETELRNSTAETCGQDGYTGDLFCTECETVLETGEIISATGNHNFETTVYDPTCAESGYTMHYCTDCGYNYSDNFIDATGNHNFETTVYDPTCVESGYTQHYCTDCDYSYTDNFIDATGNHDFENGVCTVCGHLDIEHLESLGMNDTKSVEIANSGEYKYFKFTPSINGTLNFYSTGSYDTYGYLYDSQMNELTYNDDGAEDNNFSISYDVVAGKTYILGCRMYSSSVCGNFDVVFNFEPDMSSAIIGDVDFNGKADIKDATLIQMYISTIKDFNNYQLTVADVNGDGSVTVADATQIQKYLAKLVASLN